MSEPGRRARLTDKLIKSAEPEAKRYVIWDLEKKGFGVRVETSGLKSFIVRYRANGGGRNAPRREIVIGRLDNWATEKARREAGRIFNQVDAGFDPAKELQRQRQEKTIAALCELYLQEGIETKKASTVAVDRGRIERHIKPLLGARLVSDISAEDIERFMRDVANGKTAADIKTKFRGRAIVEGGKGTASRTVGLLGGIFSFAVKRKMRPDNPVRGVKRYADNKGERFLTGQEMQRLGEALRNIAEGGANRYATTIIRLLAFTGARKGEIVGLRWSEIDFERTCLRLKDSKTGAKVIPLGPPALALLAETPRVDDKDFVFPAETGTGHFQGTEKVWRKLRTAAGMPELRLHDLRHSFASAGVLAGDNLAMIGKLLGHADTKTTARYAHLADDPVRQAANRISISISAALDGRTGGEIVPLVRIKQ